MRDIGADFFCKNGLVVTLVYLLTFLCMAPMQAQEDPLSVAAVRELVYNYFDANLASQEDFVYLDDEEDEYAPVFSRQEYNNYLLQLENSTSKGELDPFLMQEPTNDGDSASNFSSKHSKCRLPSAHHRPTLLAQNKESPHLYRTEPTPSANPPLHNHKKECAAKRERKEINPEEYTVNFEDISVVQLIQFISKIAGTNFIFNNNDLSGINVTIVSEDSTSVEDLSAALLQILKMHQLSVVEEGNNVLIYRGQNMSRVSTVITNDNPNDACDKAIITRVFPLTNVDAIKIAAIVSKMVSSQAIVEPSPETRHLIVTDITANIHRIADLLAALDNTPDVTVDIADYHVNNANPASLADYAREILKPLAIGTTFSITAEKTSQTIFIVGTPYLIEKALRILSSLDVADISSLVPPPPPSNDIQNNLFYMYKLKYTNGEEIATALHEIGTNLQSTGIANLDFVNTIYTIQWLEVNNSIVITGTQDAIDKVIALIDSLDREPKQVYIEVLILDTTLTNSLDFGVQWIALGEEQNKLAFGTGLLSTVPPNPNLQGTSFSTNPGARYVAGNPNVSATTGLLPAGANPPPLVPNPGRDLPLPNPSQLIGALDATATEAFGLGFIGNILRHNGKSFLTLGALISALDEEGDSTVVLNPKIMVEDTQPADFFVGQNIPYQTTSTVIQQTGSVTQNIQYEDIGVELQVTPTIAPNNMVTLQISQSVSDVVGLAGSTNLTPVTNKTLSTTRVHVPDGTFLVMSGHVRDQCTYIRSGIPCLGTLPLIGPLFGRTIEQRVKRNLLFFIRPKVVTNIQQGLDLTNQEGYDYNWYTNPCSIIDSCCPDAPECEMYPAPCWPLHEGREENETNKVISGWETNTTKE